MPAAGFRIDGQDGRCQCIPDIVADITFGLDENVKHPHRLQFGIDGIRFDFLSDLPKRAVSGLAGATEVFAVLDVSGNRTVGQQFESGHGSPAWH